MPDARGRAAGDAFYTLFPHATWGILHGFLGGDMRVRRALPLGALVVLTCSAASRGAEESRLLAHSPTLSKTQVVFAYGEYLWSVPREGGDARQLTTGGQEGAPVFSPDGKWIAFTGQYDGNVDVFVIPAEGGEPMRLTWHPGVDIATGWTPDGKKVLFHSNRESHADFDRLYTVPRSEEHTSELQSPDHLVCRLLLEKKKLK